MIHPNTIIEPGATLGANVKIGPFCHVGSSVTLEDNVELISHVSLSGRTIVGKGTKIYPFASIGHPPQDLKYKGEDSSVVIGENNVIREYVTIHPGTEQGHMKTTVGNNCLLMVGVHIAHDCIVGNQVIMANNATLAGHVTVGDHAIIGGLSAVHQFVRIGAHAMVGGMSGVESDVIPFGMVKGERAFLNGLNLTGLRRRGFSNETIRSLQDTYKKIFDENMDQGKEPLNLRVKKAANDSVSEPETQNLIQFIMEAQRSVCLPKAG